MSFKFTNHGRDRLLERTDLDEKSMIVRLEDEQFLPLGFERGTNRFHYLTMGSDDTTLAVLVVDIKTKEIITVLNPREQLSQFSTSLTPENINHLRSLTFSDSQGTKNVHTEDLLTAEGRSFKVRCIVYEGFGKTLDDLDTYFCYLGTFPCSDFGIDRQEMATSWKFWKELLDRLDEHGIPINRVKEFSIKLTNKDQPFIIKGTSSPEDLLLGGE